MIACHALHIVSAMGSLEQNTAILKKGKGKQRTLSIKGWQTGLSCVAKTMQAPSKSARSNV